MTSLAGRSPVRNFRPNCFGGTARPTWPGAADWDLAACPGPAISNATRYLARRRFRRRPCERAMTEIRLPKRVRDRDLSVRPGEPVPGSLLVRFNRIAFVAAQVVADPRADIDRGLRAAIDWTRPSNTGDTSGGSASHRRGDGHGAARHGVDWPVALELIRRSTAAAKAEGPSKTASGVGTDQLDPGIGAKPRRRDPRR